MQIRAIFTAILCLLSTKGSAGSWSSGGSELLGDARNPWFLSNTRQTTYCVLLDEQNAGVTKAAASALITRALDFWGQDFQNAILPIFPEFGPLKIATQVWQERTCSGAGDDSVDLRFQFGMLNQEQEDYIKIPANFAAISVRTDYDQAQLRGKGFIYVSPVHGRLSFRGAVGKPDLWSWGGGAKLYAILLHELGHVFGLPHMGAMGELMSEGFGEILAAIQHPSLEFYHYHFFTLLDRKEVCVPWIDLGRVHLRELFNMTDPAKSCLRVRYAHDPKNHQFGDVEMKAYAVSGPTDEGVLLGTATLQKSGFYFSNNSYISLSPKQ